MVRLTMIARVTDGLPLAEGLDDGRDQKDTDVYKQQAKLIFKNLSQGHYEASRMSIETGPNFFHYIIEGRVCYLTMCDRSYPKKLAFQYLEDLKNEFERVNGNQIETAARPYAFIKFDTYIQKTKKLYLDTRTQRNLAKLNDELFEVHQIMTRNVQEVLGVGEKLDPYYLNPKYYYKHNLGTRPELLSALQVVVEKLVKSRDVQTHCMNEIKYFRESLGSFGRMVAINGRNNTLPEVSEMSSRLTSESRVYADKAKDLNRQALIRKWAPVAIVLGVVFLLLWVKRKLW